MLVYLTLCVPPEATVAIQPQHSVPLTPLSHPSRPLDRVGADNGAESTEILVFSQ